MYWTQGLQTLPLNFPCRRNWTQQKSRLFTWIPAKRLQWSCWCLLNRRMCDCDKLIDPFCGNRVVLITGNAAQLSHIRSLTWSHNNKLTQSCLFFPCGYFFNTIFFNTVQGSGFAGVFARQAPYFHYRVMLKRIMLVSKQAQTVLTALAFFVLSFVRLLSHLCLHIAQLPCLLRSAAEQVCSNFNHRGRVVVDRGLL